MCFGQERTGKSIMYILCEDCVKNNYIICVFEWLVEQKESTTGNEQTAPETGMGKPPIYIPAG